jgi:hypothetical protein
MARARPFKYLISKEKRRWHGACDTSFDRGHDMAHPAGRPGSKLEI